VQGSLLAYRGVPEGGGRHGEEARGVRLEESQALPYTRLVHPWSGPHPPSPPAPHPPPPQPPSPPHCHHSPPLLHRYSRRLGRAERQALKMGAPQLGASHCRCQWGACPRCTPGGPEGIREVLHCPLQAAQPHINLKPHQGRRQEGQGVQEGEVLPGVLGGVVYHG